MDMNKIAAARTRFLDAVKAEADARIELNNKDLDLKIAQREGRPALEFEKELDRVRGKVWYPAYKELAPAAVELCDAIGVSPKELKRTLP